ncbi:limb region 1 protein homolog isoform X9 [Felis catus]|uniref:limb region 1 protein homolog isoform X9 n=1 Tax=Felis catus TaxID=9685 RepID=UPI001D1A13DC|nr:limb region 1 protein homolog isoform X9 [Felis catus]
MEGQDEVSAREQHFHSQVRESTICFLLFAVLYVVSYFIITRYKRKSDEQEDEDAIVNRISLCLSTFTLAVSAGAVLLLPFSIISNEILLSFPHNYYIQWLNGSLIHGLWNLASLFSNLCLFVLMPFAFFFLESEGFAGLKKGIRARILETLVMLILLALLILGIVWVASALIDNDAASMESLYDLWEFYLPYLYSCISLMGCLLLLLCTPVGLSRMFTVMGQLLVKPTILEDLDEQIYIITLEEEALQRRLNGLSSSVECNIMELEQELENVKTLKTKLGITRFDLLGDFGRFNWLGNFYIVLSYNLLFAIVTTLCLVRKFTSAVREELFKALGLHKLHLSDASRDSETSKPSANGHHKAL